jgi:hypothetical protein
MAVRIGGGVVAFDSDEVAPVAAIDLGGGVSCPAIPGRDYNGDGRIRSDRVLRLLPINDAGLGTVRNTELSAMSAIRARTFLC